MNPTNYHFNERESAFMQRAIELAKQGRFTTAPNPNVGCVIVKDDIVVGEGFHLRAGEPHAEVHALAAAGDAAEGATCFVTLEPCSHYGRTPPCAAALVKAKVACVVMAMIDPNPKVAGKGIAILEAAGIEVKIGLLNEQALALNPGFIKRMQDKRPYVRLKMAASLDGKTALSNGKSQWITGADARADVQYFRAQANAILSTSATVIADDASLNVRLNQSFSDVYPTENPALTTAELRQPTRIIIDNQKQLDQHAAPLKLFQQPGDIVLVNGAAKDKQDITADNGNINEHNPHFGENESISRIEINQDRHHNIDLTALMDTLGQQEINDIWVEAGATLAGALLELQLVDEVIIYLAPKLMGENARGLAVLSELTEMAQVPELRFTDVTQIGKDLRIIAKPIA